MNCKKYRDLFIKLREYSLGHCVAANLKSRRDRAWVLEKLFGERKNLDDISLTNGRNSS